MEAKGIAVINLWESLGYNMQTMALGIGILLLGMFIGMMLRRSSK